MTKREFTDKEMRDLYSLMDEYNIKDKIGFLKKIKSILKYDKTLYKNRIKNGIKKKISNNTLVLMKDIK